MIRASSNYVQSNSFESLQDARDRVRKLPKSVVRDRRVVLICSYETAQAAVGERLKEGGPNAIHGIRESLGLSAELFPSSFQRLRAGSAAVLLIGTFDGQLTSVTGSLAMLLQHYGLRRSRAIDYEAHVAAGGVVVCVSCARLPGDVCEAVYETLIGNASHQQGRVQTS